MRLHGTSTITAKGQTTVPKAVRQVLGVREGDQIEFRVEDDGTVTVAPAAADHRDPALVKFLDLLAADLVERPHLLRALSPELVKRIGALVGRRKVDLRERIDGEVDL